MRTRLTILFTVCCTLGGIAQEHCWIKYDHDAAGNRVKRYWWCGDPDEAGGEDGQPKAAMGQDLGLRLFPVPASDKLVLTSTKAQENSELDVVDAYGRRVLHTRLNGSYLEIDISEWSNGGYVLSIRAEGEEYSTGFAVSH